MSDPTTSNRGYSVPVTGTDVDLWGDVLNTNFGLIDNNIGGVASLSLTNIDVTLNSSQYQCGTIRLTGILTGNVRIIFPVVQGWWTIDNQTTGNFVATITIGSGQVIAIEQGSTRDILIDGTNVKFRNLPPVGSYLDVCDATVPAWITACTIPPYLNCDGTTFSAVTYPNLNTKLGGNTLPDSKGRVGAALNQGTSRLTTAGSGVDGDTRFASGGAQTNTISQANLPAVNLATAIASGQGSHAHTGSTSAIQVGGSGGLLGNSGGQTGTIAINTNTLPAMTGTTPLGGSGTALNNVQPTFIYGLKLIRAA